MKITPLDIRRKEFKRSVRGYSDEEVDIFLDEVADEFERLFQENMELHDRMQRMEEQIAGHAQLKDALEKTLISAQLQAEEIRANAHKESELILRDADMKARGIVSDSYGETQKTQQTLVQLKLLEEDFRYKFRSLLEGYLRLLNQAPLAGAESEGSPLASESGGEKVEGSVGPAAAAAVTPPAAPQPTPSAVPAPFGRTTPSTPSAPSAPAAPSVAAPSSPAPAPAPSSAQPAFPAQPAAGAPAAPVASRPPATEVQQTQVRPAVDAQAAIPEPAQAPPSARPVVPVMPSGQEGVASPPRPAETAQPTLPVAEDDTPTQEDAVTPAPAEASSAAWTTPPTQGRDTASEVTQESETSETRLNVEAGRPDTDDDEEPMRRFFFGRQMTEDDDTFQGEDAAKKDRNREFEW